jgi:hypothetical protein
VYLCYCLSLTLYHYALFAMPQLNMQALRSHKDTDLPRHINIWDIFTSSCSNGTNSSSNAAAAASMKTPTFASSTSTTASTTATPSGVGASSEEQQETLHKTKSGSRWGAAGIASRRKQSAGVYTHLILTVVEILLQCSYVRIVYADK